MKYSIVKYLQDQVELKLTWNRRSLEKTSNWMVYLDGTYDYLGNELTLEPSKEAIAYAVSKINTTPMHRLVINPAVEETGKTIKFEFNTQKELDAASNALADMLLFLQDEIQVMPDYSNAFAEQVLVDKEWVDVDELFD